MRTPAAPARLDGQDAVRLLAVLQRGERELAVGAQAAAQRGRLRRQLGHAPLCRAQLL